MGKIEIQHPWIETNISFSVDSKQQLDFEYFFTLNISVLRYFLLHYITSLCCISSTVLVTLQVLIFNTNNKCCLNV